MKPLRWVAAISLIGMLAGCDGGARPAAPPATRSTTPISQAPATEPTTVVLTEPPATAPTTQPGMTTLIVGQKGFWFPGAVLRLTPSRGHVVARLSSDDPPSAIETNYHGNSYDLNMTLDITDPAQIEQGAWKYTIAGNEKPDTSAHGIFLDGQRRCLHPQDVTAEFQKQGDNTIAVSLNGWFLLYETGAVDRSFASPKRVWVHGTIQAAMAP